MHFMHVGRRRGGAVSAIVAALLIAAIVPVPRALAGDQSAVQRGLAHAPGRFLVRFKPGTPSSVISSIERSTSATERANVRQIGLHVLSVPAGKSVEEMVGRFRSNPNVDFAEPDYLTQVDFTPNDPLFPNQTQSVRIGLPSAWDRTTGASDVVVAVLDSGVDASHPDLQGELVPGYDFVNGDSDPTDDNGHGTAVTGIVAERGNNLLGYAGVAWGCRVMPVKVVGSSGTASWSAIAAGLVYAADHGARIANMSFGGPGYSSTGQSAVDYALSRGMVLVASTGNDGAQVINYPAGFDGVIGVGNIAGDTLASSSTFGPDVDVVAPGNGVGTTVLPSTNSAGSRYSIFSGTSAASPFVAGIAALMLSANPGLTRADLTSTLQSTATDFGTQGWDIYYGWGRVNAAAAVAAVGGSIAPAPGPAPAPDTTVPTLQLTSPSTGTTVSGSVSISVNASDNVAVTSVQFLCDGVLIGTSGVAPFGLTWNSKNVGDGAHVLSARAFDAAGNGSVSSAVTVTVSNGTVVRTKGKSGK